MKGDTIEANAQMGFDREHHRCWHLLEITHPYEPSSYPVLSLRVVPRDFGNGSMFP